MVGNSHNQPGYSLSTELLTDQHHSLASDNHQLPTEFPYDFASFTSPTEDQEDDFFTGLTRQFALSTLLDSNKLQYAASQKKWSLSSSPQSILSPVFSNGSPTGPLQGPSSPTGPFAPTDYSWDLIREAAGQVNMLNKLKTQQALETYRGLPSSANNFTQTHSSRPHACLYNHNHLGKSLGSFWAGPQACQKRPQFGFQNRCVGGNAMCGNPHSLLNVNGFVGDSSSLFSGDRKIVPGSGVKRKCAGTGVFLPRRCPDPVESGVKSGCSNGFTQHRGAAQAIINMPHDNHAEAEPRFLDVVTPNHDMMVMMRRKAVLAQEWRNGVKMMAAAANKAIKYDTHLPQEWSY